MALAKVKICVAPLFRDMTLIKTWKAGRGAPSAPPQKKNSYAPDGRNKKVVTFYMHLSYGLTNLIHRPAYQT